MNRDRNGTLTQREDSFGIYFIRNWFLNQYCWLQNRYSNQCVTSYRVQSVNITTQSIVFTRFVPVSDSLAADSLHAVHKGKSHLLWNRFSRSEWILHRRIQRSDLLWRSFPTFSHRPPIEQNLQIVSWPSRITFTTASLQVSLIAKFSWIINLGWTSDAFPFRLSPLPSFFPLQS